MHHVEPTYASRICAHLSFCSASYVARSFERAGKHEWIIAPTPASDGSTGSRTDACPFSAALPASRRAVESRGILGYAEFANCLRAASRRNFVPEQRGMFNEKSVWHFHSLPRRRSNLRDGDDRWATIVLTRSESGGALSTARTCLKIALLPFDAKKL